jgi:aspartate/methionine/tyrosine aminotransferase
MQEALRALTRMDAVQSPIVPVIGDLIRQTPGTISLGQGVVHYGPPRQVLDAVSEALAQPSTHEYQDGLGVPALVAQITKKLAAENGIEAGQANRVMVTAGANMAFMHAVLATTVPGDEVILPLPFYFNHDMAIQMAGCRTVAVATDERCQLDVDRIARAITPRTRAIVTISPNNPSGAVFDEGALRQVSALCQAKGLYHISDETYEYFTYGSARHVSPASFANASAHTISIYSLSKAYGFAGWRVGYMVYPEHLASAMIKSQDTILICPTIASQVAATAALEVGRAYCEPFVRELAEVRGMVLGELSSLAPLAEVASADGAFYCLLRVRQRADPGRLAERLIREHKVAVIPGHAFGIVDRCDLRVAYGALQRETVTRGIGRLVDGLRKILKSEV